MGFIAKLARFWVLIVFVTIIIYFSAYNPERVFVNFPPFLESLSLPISLVFVLGLFLGASMVVLSFGFEFSRNSWKIRSLTKKLSNIEKISSKGGSREVITRNEPSVLASDPETESNS